MPTWLTELRKRFQMLWMLRNPKLEHIFILNDDDQVNTLIDAMDAEKLAAAIAHFSKNKAKHIDTTGMERFAQERHPYRFVETLIG